MAGAAGVDPWSYSLREILQILEGKRAETWDYVGWICFMMPSYSKKKKKLEDFNAYLLGKKQKEALLHDFAYEAAKKAVDLPDELSENERQIVFERMIKKHG
jgi:hypothetical protein